MLYRIMTIGKGGYIVAFAFQEYYLGLEGVYFIIDPEDIGHGNIGWKLEVRSWRCRIRLDCNDLRVFVGNLANDV